jgi:hypothetical protein
LHAFWGGVVKLEDLSGCKEEKHVTVFVFEAELDARKVIKLELHLLLFLPATSTIDGIYDQLGDFDLLLDKFFAEDDSHLLLINALGHK